MSTSTPPNLNHLTPAQLEAIRLTDCSLLVSAAAGSGKTTVLAERCVALVCDVDQPHRCPIDELLVVTFTDAAAEEMRTRIRSALRRRLDLDPASEYLQRQIHRLECASISTIHSFCKTLIEQYFPQAEVDPQAAVLSAEEADLLKEEVLHELFLAHYASGDAESLAFQALVDDYGAGDDTIIGRAVLQLHEFLSTQPDPEEWLERSLSRAQPDAPEGLLASLDGYQCQRLARELLAQIDYCKHQGALIRNLWPAAAMHADAIDEHRSKLQEWLAALNPRKLESWQPVSWDIRDFAFERAAARPRRLDDDAKAAFDAAKRLRDDMKRRFTDRLQDGLCRFSADEYREGIERVAPHVRTLVHLARGFDRGYADAKAAQAVVDFNDLQRRAYRLLRDPSDASRPSDVARQLQRKYRYVLVDEFQDIDPLQNAILGFVSRENADPPAGNLFTVGDVKQSIYRFRLADPHVFAERAARFSGGSALGRVIHLQSNFRSRKPVIDAVNLVFESLMSREFGGSDYDQHARLHAGATYPEDQAGAFACPAVEMHLLEPVTEQTRRRGAGEGEAVPEEPEVEPQASATSEEELAGIEREAFLIGRLAGSWMGLAPGVPRRQVAGRPVWAGGAPALRPIEPRDIVILLRSLPHKAEPIADVLRRMGLPVRIERMAGGFNSTEFRDCYSALQLMDNLQQDLPLTAVLRSPLLGDPFNETDLLNLRLINRDVPFHAAVRQYAADGCDPVLRERLNRILETLELYRTRIQRTPVADVLWELYEEFNYLAYVSGLPDGARRRDHLVQLHELARQFGRFARQGLRRFLHFLEELQERQREPQQHGTGGDDDCIRIMTIHASKGLEFPVVILADLNKSFNLQDVRRPILISREYGIALKASDPERRVLYPTLAHQLAADLELHESLSEELRVLYVALTRAREHLVLTGRINLDHVAACRSMQAARGAGASAALPRLQLECAANPLDWLLAALSSVPAEHVHWRDASSPRAGRLFQITTYTRQATDKWGIPPPVEPERAQALARLADLAPLPTDEPAEGTDEARRLLAAIAEPYPAAALTAVPGRVSVGELKRRWDASRDPDERLSALASGSPDASVHAAISAARPGGGRLARLDDPSALQGGRDACPPESELAAQRRAELDPSDGASIDRDFPRPAFLRESAVNDPAARGTAAHRFLQLLDFTRLCTAADLRAQLTTMCEAGRLTAADADRVPVERICWFMETELGRRLRAHPAAVQREVAFDARVELERFDPRLQAHDPRDCLLVRGVIDVVLDGPAGVELIDYKTDQVPPAAVPQRVEVYRPQLEIYAHAVEGIYRAKVTRCWLVFLEAGRIEEVSR